MLLRHVLVILSRDWVAGAAKPCEPTGCCCSHMGEGHVVPSGSPGVSCLGSEMHFMNTGPASAPWAGEPWVCGRVRTGEEAPQDRDPPQREHWDLKQAL